jgi:hypothetical protein
MRREASSEVSSDGLPEASALEAIAGEAPGFAHTGVGANALADNTPAKMAAIGPGLDTVRIIEAVAYQAQNPETLQKQTFLGSQ